MDTYFCDGCKQNIKLEHKENHELYCLNSIKQSEYENLIPCEICNNLIEFDSYNEHIKTCQVSTNQYNFLNRYMSDFSNINRTRNLNYINPNNSRLNFLNSNNQPLVSNLNNQNTESNIDTQLNQLEEMITNLERINRNIEENTEEQEQEHEEIDNNLNNNLEAQEQEEIDTNLNNNHYFQEQIGNNLNIQNNIPSNNANLFFNMMGIDIGTIANILDTPQINNFNTNNYLYESNNVNEYEMLTNLANELGTVNVGINNIDKYTKIINEEYICSICQENNNVLRETKCKHKFCLECINEWVKENKTCPLCMQELQEL